MPPPAEETARRVIGAVTVELACFDNANVVFGPLLRRLRGRWSWANMRRGESSESGLMEMPDLPGLQLTIDPERMEARVEDPLTRPEYRETVMEANRAMKKMKGELITPLEPVRMVNMDENQIATWLYWFWRLLGCKHCRGTGKIRDEGSGLDRKCAACSGRPSKEVIVISGTIPTLREIAAAYPKARIKRDFHGGLSYSEEERSTRAADVQKQDVESTGAPIPSMPSV
jgi:hypothetical protein